MQPRSDEVIGVRHLAGHLRIARFIRSYEAQATKLMKKLQIADEQEE
jgi:hypothetical protein